MKFQFTVSLILLSLGSRAFALTHATGLIMPADWRKNAVFVREPIRADLPAAFDWREKAALPPIKNQGMCGSCWAFAQTGVFESLIAIKTKQIVDLAEQELIDCDTVDQGCNGGYFTGFDYQKTIGQTYTTDYPYKAVNGTCAGSSLPHDYKLADWAYLGGSGSNAESKPTTDEIKSAIMTHGPVAAAVYAEAAFDAYAGGVFSTCSSGAVNHMIVLVGWDDSTQTWIVRNSWGSSWGENGYIRIQYGCNDIADVAAYADYHLQ